MGNSKRLITLVCAFAALLMSTSVLAGKPTPPPPTPTPPAPLAVYGSNGVNAGRFMGYLGTATSQKVLWAIVTANGVVTSAPFGVGSSSDEANFRWFPHWGEVYYASSNCTGQPLIAWTGVEPVEAYAGMRRSFAHWDGSIKLYVASAAAPTTQLAYSFQNINYCRATGCQYTLCSTLSGYSLKTWAVETVIDLEALYPSPLTIR